MDKPTVFPSIWTVFKTLATKAMHTRIEEYSNLFQSYLFSSSMYIICISSFITCCVPSCSCKQRSSKHAYRSNNCSHHFHDFAANAGWKDDEAGCLVADRGNRGAQCNPRNKRIVFGRRGLVELGIFMSNGRADSENGIGESGKAKRRRGEEEGGK